MTPHLLTSVIPRLLKKYHQQIKSVHPHTREFITHILPHFPQHHQGSQLQILLPQSISHSVLSTETPIDIALIEFKPRYPLIPTLNLKLFPEFLIALNKLTLYFLSHQKTHRWLAINTTASILPVHQFLGRIWYNATFDDFTSPHVFINQIIFDLLNHTPYPQANAVDLASVDSLNSRITFIHTPQHWAYETPSAWIFDIVPNHQSQPIDLSTRLPTVRLLLHHRHATIYALQMERLSHTRSPQETDIPSQFSSIYQAKKNYIENSPTNSSHAKKIRRLAYSLDPLLGSSSNKTHHDNQVFRPIFFSLASALNLLSNSGITTLNIPGILPLRIQEHAIYERKLCSNSNHCTYPITHSLYQKSLSKHLLFQQLSSLINHLTLSVTSPQSNSFQCFLPSTPLTSNHPLLNHILTSRPPLACLAPLFHN